MTSPSVSARGSIVVGVDGSPSGEHAVLWAVEEGRLQHRGLRLVHAQRLPTLREEAWLSGAGISTKEVADRAREDAQQILERARSLAADRLGASEVETLLATGDPRSALLEISEGAPLLVVGSRGHGPVVGLLLGSVSAALVRHTSCPVAVVRSFGESGRGVLVGADGSEASLAPVELAFAEASARGLQLTVVHCVWDALAAQVRWSRPDRSDPDVGEARLRISESLAGMSQKYPDVTVRVWVAKGAIDSCLVDLSRQFDLLVIGRPPRSLGQRLLLSGLTTSIAEHAASPVIVVP